jgi:alkaline phosphatase
MEHGALEYIETAGDDLEAKGFAPFRGAARSKPGEAVVFSWIVYKSRAHRDSVNKRVMKDPRIMRMTKTAPLFDMKRMAYGGFKALVDLK